MAGRRSNIGAWVQIDPDRARKEILKASKATGGVVRDIAKSFDVSECTMHRIITRLAIRDDVKRAGIV